MDKRELLYFSLQGLAVKRAGGLFPFIVHGPFVFLEARYRRDARRRAGKGVYTNSKH